LRSLITIELRGIFVKQNVYMSTAISLHFLSVDRCAAVMIISRSIDNSGIYCRIRKYLFAICIRIICNIPVTGHGGP
jgi:hypothetical protein